MGIERSCGMLMTLLMVGLCQSCVLGLILFVHVVQPLATTPNLPRVLLLLMNDGRQKLLHAIFGDLGVQVVTGHRFLGGFIGSQCGRGEYVMSKVRRWVGHVNVLAQAASTRPQLAYAALTRSLQDFPATCCSAVWPTFSGAGVVTLLSFLTSHV